VTGPRWSPYCGLHTEADLSLMQWVASKSRPGVLAEFGVLHRHHVNAMRVATGSGILASEITGRRVRAGITAHGMAALALDQPPWVYAAVRTWPRVTGLRHIAADPGCQATAVAIAIGVNPHTGAPYVDPLIKAGLVHCRLQSAGNLRGGWSLTITDLGTRMLAPIAEYTDPAFALAGVL